MAELLEQTKSLLKDISTQNLIPGIGIGHVSVNPIVATDAAQKACNCESKCDKDETSKDNQPDKWLVIGIPTVARLHDEPYLLKTLESIALQLPTDENDILYGKVVISVVNMQQNKDISKKHIVFEEAKSKYSEEKNSVLARYFTFEEIKSSEFLPDPLPGRNADNDLGNANKPGFLVRRQTRNLVTVLRRNIGKGKYYLFMEDDMLFCKNSLMAIMNLLQKSSLYHPNWLAIRASYGMNGIFMHNKDLSVFADYLQKHQVRRPPDHLVVEWYAGETPEAVQHKAGRVNVGYKYNLFDHLGVVSTLRSERSTSYPRCYELLMEPTVFKVEAYNPQECPRDDIWPCNVSSEKRRPPINWATLL